MFTRLLILGCCLPPPPSVGWCCFFERNALLVNQRRANPHLQLVILCSAHQPCLSNKKRVSKTKICFHSHVFFFCFLICFSHVVLLGLFSPDKPRRNRRSTWWSNARLCGGRWRAHDSSGVTSPSRTQRKTDCKTRVDGTSSLQRLVSPLRSVERSSARSRFPREERCQKIGIDSGFFGRDREDVLLILCVKCRSSSTGCLGAFVLGCRNCEFGVQEVLTPNNERSLLGLVECVSNNLRGVELVLMTSPEEEHVANGLVEVGVREIKAQTRILRGQLEQWLGDRIDEKDQLTSWIPWHAAKCVSTDGRRSHAWLAEMWQDLGSPVVELGESVHFGLVGGNTAMRGGHQRMLRSVCVGHHERSGAANENRENAGAREMGSLVQCNMYRSSMPTEARITEAVETFCACGGSRSRCWAGDRDAHCSEVPRRRQGDGREWTTVRVSEPTIRPDPSYHEGGREQMRWTQMNACRNVWSSGTAGQGEVAEDLEANAEERHLVVDVASCVNKACWKWCLLRRRRTNNLPGRRGAQCLELVPGRCGARQSKHACGKFPWRWACRDCAELSSFVGSLVPRVTSE